MMFPKSIFIFFIFIFSSGFAFSKNTNDTLQYLKNIKILPYYLDEKAFVISGKKEEFEQKHKNLNKNLDKNTEDFCKILDNDKFLSELEVYKPNNVPYNVFCMGKWERKYINKTHYLVLYGIYTNIEYGIANYYLASFDEKGAFLSKIDLFGYSLVKGRISLKFDKKNTVLMGVKLSDISPNAPNKEDLYFKIPITPKGFLNKSNAKTREIKWEDVGNFLLWWFW